MTEYNRISSASQPEKKSRTKKLTSTSLDIDKLAKEVRKACRETGHPTAVKTALWMRRQGRTNKQIVDHLRRFRDPISADIGATSGRRV